MRLGSRRSGSAKRFGMDVQVADLAHGADAEAAVTYFAVVPLESEDLRRSLLVFLGTDPKVAVGAFGDRRLGDDEMSIDVLGLGGLSPAAGGKHEATSRTHKNTEHGLYLP